ncbi:MAG: hypothetical protein HC902_00405 [Calothrix sp. SM1_5_4]|nr:hypothetical protein [Calothrix sp. SM1_5_4]
MTVKCASAVTIKILPRLTLEPGTKVYGAPGSYLAILRGSQIFANGTATAPVVFTSLQRTNLRPGLWGGIVINGNAPINNCKPGASVCEAENEGIKNDPPKFGGNNPTESSGSLKYVRIEYAGFELSKDNELNGLTFYGVGSGTEVDGISVLYSADDGVEVFGGTVNLRRIVIVNPDDDGLDWDMGWTGKAQFVYIETNNGTEDSNGIEADNLKSPMTAEPRSNPTLSNVTIVAKNASNARLFNGILLRRGTGGQLHNFIVTGTFNVSCVNIDDQETFRNAGVATAAGVEQTGLKMVNSIVNCAGGKNFEDKADDLFAVSSWFNGANKSANLLVDPMLKGRLPAENSPAVGAGSVPQVSGPWQFTKVDYVGAFSPYEDEDWSAGWSGL